jgi:hypothetical protein
MDNSIENLKMIRKRVEILSNPISSILIPLGIVIAASAFIQMDFNATVTSLIIWQIVLFCLGFGLINLVQKWNSKKFGSIVPDEDSLTYLIRNSSFLLVVFASSVVYGSIILAYDFGKWLGVFLGFIGMFSSVVLTILLVANIFDRLKKKENPRFERVFENNSYIIFYFLSMWSAFEFLTLFLAASSIPIFMSLAGIALCLLLLWLRDTNINMHLILLSVTFALMSFVAGSVYISGSMGFIIDMFNFLPQSSINFPWLFIGFGVIAWGIFEYKKMVDYLRIPNVS